MNISRRRDSHSQLLYPEEGLPPIADQNAERPESQTSKKPVEKTLRSAAGRESGDTKCVDRTTAVHHTHRINPRHTSLVRGFRARQRSTFDRLSVVGVGQMPQDSKPLLPTFRKSRPSSCWRLDRSLGMSDVEQDEPGWAEVAPVWSIEWI